MSCLFVHACMECIRSTKKGSLSLCMHMYKHDQEPDMLEKSLNQDVEKAQTLEGRCAKLADLLDAAAGNALCVCVRECLGLPADIRLIQHN